MINLSHNKNICCGSKKVVAKSRAWVYFEQQILALLLVFHQTHNLSRNKFARALANQPISAPHFFNPQQMFLLRVKLITPGDKRETINIDQNLQRNNVARQAECFCISYFVTLKRPSHGKLKLANSCWQTQVDVCEQHKNSRQTSWQTVDDK